MATFIWASSFVLVKIILPQVGPLTIAGFRYFLAFLILFPFMLKKRSEINTFSRKTWLLLALIGISAYTVGNGALFWGLQFLPATTTSLLLGASPLAVLFAGTIFLKETPTWGQVAGVLVSLFGNLLFFSIGLAPGEPLGISIVIIGMLGFTAFGILGRYVARAGQMSTLLLTGIPLGIGGGLLFLIGIPLEGWPVFDIQTAIILLWLAAVNTAAAYMLYNHALKSITALEMNVMLNVSPFGTALLAWILLGEGLERIQIWGIAVVIVGITLVQARKRSAQA